MILVRTMDYPTVAEVDLSTIRRNIGAVRDRIGPTCKLLVAVKADGYGHGAIEISKAAEKSGVDMLGVATVAEGVELREGGIQLPILVFGPPLAAEIEESITHDLTLTVCGSDESCAIQEVAGKMEKPATVHLKVDTGMGRLGCPPDETAEHVKAIQVLHDIRLEAIYSHFPVADDPDDAFNRTQIETFKGIRAEVSSSGGEDLQYHLSNSAGVLHYPEACFDMVRVGILVYGHFPSPKCQRNLRILPAMTLKSRLLFTKRLPKGTAVSYGHSYATAHETTLGTVQIGYGDGYPRALSNRGSVMIEGRNYPIVGRICMDQTLVALGNDDYPVGTEVTLFGKGDITADTVAEWLGAIPYEVTSGLTKRVKRIYLR